jgi:hypothetical protein
MTSLDYYAVNCTGSRCACTINYATENTSHHSEDLPTAPCPPWNARGCASLCYTRPIGRSSANTRTRGHLYTLHQDPFLHKYYRTARTLLDLAAYSTSMASSGKGKGKQQYTTKRQQFEELSPLFEEAEDDDETGTARGRSGRQRPRQRSRNRERRWPGQAATGGDGSEVPTEEPLREQGPRDQDNDRRKSLEKPSVSQPAGPAPSRSKSAIKNAQIDFAQLSGNSQLEWLQQECGRLTLQMYKLEDGYERLSKDLTADTTNLSAVERVAAAGVKAAERPAQKSDYRKLETEFSNVEASLKDWEERCNVHGPFMKNNQTMCLEMAQRLNRHLHMVRLRAGNVGILLGEIKSHNEAAATVEFLEGRRSDQIPNYAATDSPASSPKEGQAERAPSYASSEVTQFELDDDEDGPMEGVEGKEKGKQRVRSRSPSPEAGGRRGRSPKVNPGKKPLKRLLHNSPVGAEHADEPMEQMEDEGDPFYHSDDLALSEEDAYVHDQFERDDYVDDDANMSTILQRIADMERMNVQQEEGEGEPGSSKRPSRKWEL